MSRIRLEFEAEKERLESDLEAEMRSRQELIDRVKTVADTAAKTTDGTFSNLTEEDFDFSDEELAEVFANIRQSLSETEPLSAPMRFESR